jgi:hypothetical protein
MDKIAGKTFEEFLKQGFISKIKNITSNYYYNSGFINESFGLVCLLWEDIPVNAKMKIISNLGHHAAQPQVKDAILQCVKKDIQKIFLDSNNPYKSDYNSNYYLTAITYQCDSILTKDFAEELWKPVFTNAATTSQEFFRKVLSKLSSPEVTKQITNLVESTDFATHPYEIRTDLMNYIIATGNLKEKTARKIRSDASILMQQNCLKTLFGNLKLYSEEQIKKFILRFLDSSNQGFNYILATQTPAELVIHLTTINHHKDLVIKRIEQQR